MRTASISKTPSSSRPIIPSPSHVPTPLLSPQMKLLPPNPLPRRSRPRSRCRFLSLARLQRSRPCGLAKSIPRYTQTPLFILGLSGALLGHQSQKSLSSQCRRKPSTTQPPPTCAWPRGARRSAASSSSRLLARPRARRAAGASPRTRTLHIARVHVAIGRRALTHRQRQTSV